ncbi:MAG: GNAT family protein [Anaerolineae bacterium]|jgi:RimJ/RimL family protein N-acetyltransferase
MTQRDTFLVAGERVVLRDLLPSDAEDYVRWQVSGEWRRFDAPWETMRTSMTEEETEAFRQRFHGIDAQALSVPRAWATIATREDRPLGWVNRYTKERFPDVWYVGINICEDDCLGRGMGTEALGLWIDYLFRHSDVHRIGLDTWSFNPRMMRVAEKLGFVYEGAERELMAWQGERLDFVHYGLLRREWAERRGRGG